MLVATNKELYVTLPKKQKMMLSQSIVNAVRSQIPPGRFLQKDVQNDLWYDVGDKRAQEKTSQALREGAPEIRTKISHAAVGAKNTTHNHTTTETHPEIPLSSSTTTENDIPNRPTVVEDDATMETNVLLVTVPPVPLGPATSKEQMPPPPSTIPSSSSAAAISLEHIHPTSGPHSGVPQNDDDNDNHNNNDDEDDETTETTPLPPPTPLVPMPMSFQHDAQAVCSFGSMGLMSDMDQARLMQSLTTTTTMMGGEDGSNKYNDVRSVGAQQRHYSGGGGGTVYSHTTDGNTSTTTHPGNATYDHNGTFYYNRSNNQQYTSSTLPLPWNHYQSQGSNGYDYPPPRQGPSYDDFDIRNYTPAQYHTQPPLQDVRMPQPVDGGLEPVSFSIGSMMSIGTCSKLEDAGFSFGSAMSCTPIPVNTNVYPLKPGEFNGGEKPYQHASVRPPDGGLQDVGTSFGSLSLADGERERIIADADRDMAALNDYMNQGDHRSADHHRNHHSNKNNNDSDDVFYDNPIPTTLLHQQKSRGSLLDTNDHGDEGDDTTSAEARSQKGAHEWTMLQATVAMQDESVRNVISVPSTMLVTNSTIHFQQQQQPPSSGYHQHHSNFDIPTSLDRDYSQMSAISVGDDFEAPMQPPTLSYSSSVAYSSNNISSSSNHRHHTTNTSDLLENDSNWDQYESSIRQEAMLPPILKKSCTNRY